MGVSLRIIQGSLRNVRGQNRGNEIPVRRRSFLIGTAERCHLRCLNQSLNALHCVIDLEPDRIVVRDRGGLLGTYVNGHRIDGSACLFHGDRLRIGRLEFEVAVELPATTAIVSPRPESLSPPSSVETICQATDTVIDLRNKLVSSASRSPGGANVQDRMARTG